jgi:acyl-CoA thioester hydrolase
MQAGVEIFEIHIDVVPSDIDSLDHVNNVSYLRWVQQVAIAHWQHSATVEDQEKWLWIVLRHEIDYKQPAVLGDEILARTWVGAAGRLKFERHTQLFRASDGALLAQAFSLWCPIDARTRRPTPASEELRQRFSVAAGK